MQIKHSFVSQIADDTDTSKVRPTNWNADHVITGTLPPELEGAAVASATVCNIWATDGNTRHITGTTQIESLGTAPQAGAWMKIIFDGVLTLKNGANLILQGNADIITAANSFAFVYAETTTQFRVLYFNINGYLPLSGGTLNGALVHAVGSSVASASTINLTNVVGNACHIAGTTQINAVTLAAGKFVEVIFDGVLVLTHHATNNHLPAAGSNITTAANDRAIYWSDGTTVYCLHYEKADGKAVRDVDVRDISRNLVISTVNNYQVAATADEIILQDSSNSSSRITSFSSTMDITVSGANGLDTGAEANSTWYHIWAIAKEDGTKAGLLSASATAPTLPSGYTYKAYLGAIYNDASGNFITIQQQNQIVNRLTVNVLSGGTATGYTSVSLSTAVPPTAKKCAGNLTQAGASSNTYLAISSNSVGEQIFGSAVSGYNLITAFSLVVWTAQTLFYKCTGAGPSLNIDITGWEF